MKIEQFETFLHDDLSWRKKEISELFLLASESGRETLLKSLILILYAHWEGYIKKSSKLYIKFIVEEKVRIQELTFNFKAIALKDSAQKCLETSESLTLANEFKLLGNYNEIEQKKFKIQINPDDDQGPSIINTHNNLKPKVFKNILHILGLKYNNALETREVYINNNLLFNRNAIGHGSKFEDSLQENFTLSLNDIAKLKDFILIVIDFYTEMLLDYIEKKFYLIVNDQKRADYDHEKEKKLDKLFEELEEKYKD